MKLYCRPFGDDKIKVSTKCGHCLDKPNAKIPDPSPERGLNPLSNCIIKILLHSICIWVASSNDKVRTTVIIIFHFNIESL